MKTKALLVMAAIVAFAGSVFGQGQVVLANNASSLITIRGATAPVGSLSFQLHFGPVGTPVGSLMPVGPVVGTFGLLPGRIYSTFIDIPTAVVPAGGAATFQIRAWPSIYASGTEAGQYGWSGRSILFNANSSPEVAPPPLPVSLAGLYPGFDVGLVPEPSTFALLGLGVVSLLLFRRRRVKTRLGPSRTVRSDRMTYQIL